jgi:RND family efflux transporter MFP subunit
MSLRHQLVVALLLAVVGVLIAFAIVRFPPPVDHQEDEVQPPLVQFIKVKLERLRMDVRTQGRVMAKTEIDLVAGVSGNIIKISPVFISGGFFNKGDLLVAIDPAEYDLRVAQAQARVMEAQYQLTREEAEAEQAQDEWRQLGRGDPNPLSLRIPQLKEKKAKLVAEQEELKNARLLRQRTDIKAPFDGRVRNKTVGLGQYIDEGKILGSVYSSDIAEVRLPIKTHQLAMIGFPDLPQHKQSVQPIIVKLTANYRGQLQTWQGEIVRSEGVIDHDTGMVRVIAQVRDPFGLETLKDPLAGEKWPTAILPIGLFVEAIIEGREFDDLTVIPASALHKNQRVAIIDQEHRLRFRSVEIFKREREQVFIKTGLNAGEQVLTAGLHHPVEGMEVTPIESIP